MVDLNAFPYEIFSSFFIGLITTAILRNWAKIISLLLAFPLIIVFLIGILTGTQIHNVADLNPWVTWFVTNSIPLIVTGAFEGFGAELARRWFHHN